MAEPFLAGLVVAGRVCVIVGGDREADDKTHRLLAAGATVRLVAPALEPEPLRTLAASGAIEWRARTLAPGDTAGAFLVVCTERDEALARALYAEALRPGGFLLCCIDQPAYCTFTNVALVRRGPLQIALATAGGAPMLAARIRAALEAQLAPDFTAFVERLAALRAATPAAARRDVMTRALEGFAMTVSYVLPDRGPTAPLNTAR